MFCKEQPVRLLVPELAGSCCLLLKEPVLGVLLMCIHQRQQQADRSHGWLH